MLRVYHAHSASVTSISVSPYPPPLPTGSDLFGRVSTEEGGQTSKPASDHSQSPKQSKTQRQINLPSTPSNSIYIATSSIDGNVCVSSLVNPKDVQLRNFGRPIQAVSLSPEYKSDRTYLSGGRAGSLVVTTGGRVGASSKSTLITGNTSNSSGWFGSLGFGANNGKDTVLHSGEGTINAIKWSLSGKYVVWVNEEGIKIMRSNLHLENVDSEFAWKRMCHIDRPDRPGWEEMASVWKPRCEWVDENMMELDDNNIAYGNTTNDGSNYSNNQTQEPRKQKSLEKLVVGWGGTIWVINVFPGGSGVGKNAGERTIGSVEVPTVYASLENDMCSVIQANGNRLRLDCLISGISLYTPKLILVLSYIVLDESHNRSRQKESGSQRGIRHKQNGLEPELLLIDIETKEEISADTLTVRRYATLSAEDYHLGVFPPNRGLAPTTQRGALETIGTGLLDATLYPTRLFGSGGSIRSGTSSGDKGSGAQIEGSYNQTGQSSSDMEAKELASTATAGTKIFIHSPYDCVIAVKRRLSDRLHWLTTHEQYEEAWCLIDQHPEAVIPSGDGSDGAQEASKGQGSLAEFFADDTAPTIVSDQAKNHAAEREKRRVGERWLEQLIERNDWKHAGEVCQKVLETTSRWEHWIWTFTKNNKFDEITPYIPTEIDPPLPSLIYEVILGHYVLKDRVRFEELINCWPTEIFDVTSIITAIEDQFDLKIVTQDTEDWRILRAALAKLYLSGGHYREALQCYIQLQDADTAMSLIREYHLLDAISDDIPGLVLIRVTKQQLKSSPLSELEEATAEPIKLLVREASNGIVHPETVVSQLQASNKRPFLYFYLRALWRGDSASEKRAPRARGRYQNEAAGDLMADESRALIDPFADTAVELFADYNRQLLMEFLKSSTSYSYSAASSICEVRRFTPELIYLLSKTGQTKRALSLILSDLRDISQAISFAKSQDDPDLWDDLLSYSMDKPDYIRSLLAEAGTSIDPIKLVRRIPSGLEIEGLREGLTRMIREHDIQASISQGVAKVLIGEVAIRMETLRRGQKRGIKFDVLRTEVSENKQPNGQDTTLTVDEKQESQSGHCGGCNNTFVEQGTVFPFYSLLRAASILLSLRRHTYPLLLQKRNL